MAVLAAALRRPATPQGQQLRGAEEAFKSVVVEVNIETVAENTRRSMKPPENDIAARAVESSPPVFCEGIFGSGRHLKYLIHHPP